MERACAFSLPLASGAIIPRIIAMCKPFRDYLGLARDYTREIITFGGFALMCFVYSDFRQLARDQSSTAAQTVEILRVMDARLAQLEHTKR